MRQLGAEMGSPHPLPTLRGPEILPSDHGRKSRQKSLWLKENDVVRGWLGGFGDHDIISSSARDQLWGHYDK